MKKEGNPFVAIPASLGGLYLGLVCLLLIFARDQVVLAVPLIWGFVVLGIAALFFAYLAQKKKKK